VEGVLLLLILFATIAANRRNSRKSAIPDEAEKAAAS
jgi:hypothetical protein